VARDAPDGVLIIEIGITLGQEVVPPSSLTQEATLALDRLTTSSASYQTVISYTVPAGKVGILSGLEIAASNYTLAQFQVTIAGEVKFTDKYFQTPFNPTFPEVNLAAGDVVLIEAKSDGATSITVDGAIEGKEIG
jgi:hypothetical protein